MSLSKLALLTISKEKLFELFEKVLEEEPSDIQKDLEVRISSAKLLKPEDLKGLRSKLSALNSSELRPLFNPHPDKKINLRDVIENNKIAYFQLNMMEFKDLNSVIVRFIMSDLNFLASQMASGTLEKKAKFVAVYLDEALKVMDESFPDILRMVRSSGIGVTLIGQSLANLTRRFGEAFREEVISETKISLHFEIHAPSDIEIITLIPGTMERFKRSFAVDLKSVRHHSDRGSDSEQTVKYIESNTPRRLKRGDCLFYNKVDKCYDLMASWSAKEPGVVPKSLDQIKKMDFMKTKKVSGEKLKRRSFSAKELQLMEIKPQDWHRLPNFSVLEEAIELRKSWSRPSLYKTKIEP